MIMVGGQGCCMAKAYTKQWYEDKAGEKQLEWQDAIDAGDTEEAEYLMQECLNYQQAAAKIVVEGR